MGKLIQYKQSKSTHTVQSSIQVHVLLQGTAVWWCICVWFLYKPCPGSWEPGYEHIQGLSLNNRAVHVHVGKKQAQAVLLL